ncbi:hypothetical protein ACFE04_015204 [Oxalis oulophora]
MSYSRQPSIQVKILNPGDVKELELSQQIQISKGALVLKSSTNKDGDNSGSLKASPFLSEKQTGQESLDLGKQRFEGNSKEATSMSTWISKEAPPEKLNDIFSDEEELKKLKGPLGLKRKLSPAKMGSISTRARARNMKQAARDRAIVDLRTDGSSSSPIPGILFELRGTRMEYTFTLASKTTVVEDIGVPATTLSDPLFIGICRRELNVRTTTFFFIECNL